MREETAKRWALKMTKVAEVSDVMSVKALNIIKLSVLRA